MEVMFGRCHISFCWEISTAEHAGVANVLIKQRCDYPARMSGCFACAFPEKAHACPAAWAWAFYLADLYSLESRHLHTCQAGFDLMSSTSSSPSQFS